MIEKNIKDLEVKFIGKMDWETLKDFLINKLQEAQTEKDFTLVMEALIGSMFRNAKELDKTRKALQLKHLTRVEKEKMNKFTSRKIKNEN